MNRLSVRFRIGASDVRPARVLPPSNHALASPATVLETFYTTLALLCVLLLAGGRRQDAYGQVLPGVEAATSEKILWYRQPADKMDRGICRWETDGLAPWSLDRRPPSGCN